MQNKQGRVRRGTMAALVAALVAGTAPTARAEISVDQYVAPYIAYTNYVAFSATPMSGRPYYRDFSASEHYRGVTPKYFDLRFETGSSTGARGGCIEISTYAVVSGQTADTEILAKPDGSTKWVRLSDDLGSSRFSKARVFLQFGIDILDAKDYIRVAAYAPANNNEHFNFLTRIVDGVTTEAACFSDPNIAQAFIDRAERLYIRKAI